MKETSRKVTSLKKVIYTVAVLLLIICNVFNKAVGCNPNKVIDRCYANSMSIEAMHFIANLPADLQNKQTDAIKQLLQVSLRP